MRCMGDKPNVTIGDAEEPIITLAKRSEELRDEVYLQVMKQLTENPSVDRAASGWVLLEHLCSTALPSEKLSEFVRGFLEKMLASPRDDDEEPEQKPKRTRVCSVTAETEMRTKGCRAAQIEFLKVRRPALVRNVLDVFLHARSQLPS